MIVPIPHKTVTSIIKQYDTDGHSPYLVLSDELEKYVLKTFKNSHDRPSIVKEFLCISLLNYWNINTPSVATMSLSPGVFDSPYVLNNNRFSYSTSYFGSTLMENAIDLQLLIAAKGKISSRKILNPEILMEIALFDIWIENDDRKPSNNNLLLCPENNGLLITAIDHALTFASLQFNQLNPNYVSFSDNDSILFSPFGLAVTKQMKINSKWLAKTKEKFYLCTLATEKSFLEICDNLPVEFQLSEEEKDKLAIFLFNKERNKKVFDQFSYIVSNIK